MEKGNFSQLELFSKNQGYSGVKKDSNRTFFSYIRNYEKIIFIIIGFIITGMVSFSLGVEKGRKTATLKLNSHLDMAATDKKGSVEIQPATPTQTIKPEQVRYVLEEKKDTQDYTIQVATFKTVTYAQKEAEQLKKKGFETLVVPKGKYTIVCVGSFYSKETAEPLLSKLKKHYQDCFIRRL